MGSSLRPPAAADVRPDTVVSAHTIAFGAVPFAGFAAQLTAAGLRRVGVPVPQLEAGDRVANLDALAAFEVLDLVQPSAVTVAHPQRWPAEQERLRQCIALAAEVGAQILYLTTGPRGELEWEAAADRFAAAIAPVRADARAAGVTLAIENTMMLRADISFVHRLGDAVDLARLAGITVCADLFSAWTDRGLGETIATGADIFSLVQVADYVLGTLDTPGRAVPGDGAVPIARQLGYLRAAGYAGPLEVEISGPRIDAEGPANALARGVAVTSALLSPVS